MFNCGNGLGAYSGESNMYFENIEKYVPENKIKAAKLEMAGVFGLSVMTLVKTMKKKDKDETEEDWVSESAEESYKRTVLAFQKIVLYDDEAKRLRRL